MAEARWVRAFVVVLGVCVIAGCGNAGDAQVTVRRVAIVTPGQPRDDGWNQQGIDAAKEVGAERSLRVVVRSRAGHGDVADELTHVAAPDTLVIAHDRDYASAAGDVAARSRARMLVFGAADKAEPGRVGNVEVAAEQGGYLAGYIAARASYVRSVGIVVTADDPLWYRTAGGFIAGALRFDPNVKIRYTRVGPSADDDVGAARRAARAQIVRGTQMVLGLGREATLGVMRAAEDALQGRGQRRFDACFIDVVGDKARGGHRSLTGLTAIVWNFTPAYRRALADLAAGRFGKRPYTLNLANGGVQVIANGRTPVDNYEAAMELADQIVAGKLRVPVTETDAEVRDLLTLK